MDAYWTEILLRVADLRSRYFKHYDSLPAAVPVPAETLDSYAGTYEHSPEGKVAEITVDHDHLTIVRRGKMRVGIPISTTEFLVFDPNDIAMYYKVTFHKLADGGVGFTRLRRDLEPVAAATKAE